MTVDEKKNIIMQKLESGVFPRYFVEITQDIFENKEVNDIFLDNILREMNQHIDIISKYAHPSV